MPEAADLRHRLLTDDRAFQSEVVDGIDGWLDPYTSLMTMAILTYQERNGLAGPLLEIGTYKGKYFAVLARSAEKTTEDLVGIDRFDYVEPAVFEAGFRAACAPFSDLQRMTIIAGSSGDWPPARLIGVLKQPARFISVDGSHQYQHVLEDLKNVEQVLSPGGVVAADDYLNPIDLGVGQAVNEFLSGTTALVPFAYVANKLMICRREFLAQYQEVFKFACLAAPEQKGLWFQQCHTPEAMQNIRAHFHGVDVWTLA